MTSRFTAMALLLGSSVLGTSIAADAQVRRMKTAEDTQQQQQQQQAQPAEGGMNPSQGAAQALIELQNAVDARDTASIPAKLAAAQAVVTTPQDRFLLASLRYRAAALTKDNAGIASAVGDLLATGLVEPTKVTPLTRELARARINLKQYDQAAAALNSLVAANPNDRETLLLLADIRAAQGNPEAIALYQKAIAQAKAAGAKPEEALYQRAVSQAYKSGQTSAFELSRSWVSDYPTVKNWRDALGIYRNLAKPADDARLNILRLARATNALNGASDYEQLAYLTLTRGYPREAKAVLEEGKAAGQIDTAKSPFKELLAEAETKAARDPVTVSAAAQAGMSASSAKAALTHGDLLYGLGEYGEAAKVYRAALGKAGADEDMVNLHLGMALARAGDRAAATEALNAVGGEHSQLAKYWLLYLTAKA